MGKQWVVFGFGIVLALGSAGAQVTPVRPLPPSIDITDWTREGNVAVLPPPKVDGKPGLRLGPGRSSIRARFAMKGLHVMLVGSNVLSPIAKAELRVQCLDSKGRLLMTLTCPCPPSKTGFQPGIYFKTHALTSSLLVSIDKLDADGTMDVLFAEVRDDDQNRKPHESGVKAEEMLEPIWSGSVAYNETVLLQTSDTGEVSGKLLFEPTRIISVQDYSLDKTYVQGVDFSVSHKKLIALPGSKMPSTKPSDFETGELKWNVVMGKHVVVTYDHVDHWSGFIAANQSANLPNTVRKLRSNKPFVIATSGDSITLGVGTSAYSEIRPYMPTWPELVVQGLQKTYHHPNIQLFNTALGGMTSEWGAENAEHAVASLNPDLVLIAYGMNDFWGMPSDQFLKNIKAIIDRVRAKNPKAEFILISPMHFDPAYTSDPQYLKRLESYGPALRSLEQVGVCMLDMTSITHDLYAAKPPKDFVSDPLHPNDYLARWYAQSVLAMLAPAERR